MLVVVSLAQFIVLVDAVVVNVALPTIKRDLGFSDQNLAWIIDAYLLACSRARPCCAGFRNLGRCCWSRGVCRGSPAPARGSVSPMDLGESLIYLRHRLALAGRTDPLFADDAVARLHRAANGLPRQLNNAATAALIAAAAEGKALVDDACAKRRC